MLADFSIWLGLCETQAISYCAVNWTCQDNNYMHVSELITEAQLTVIDTS